MTQRGKMLGAFEEAVLLALVRLGPDAYGMRVRRLLAERLERDVSIGAVYATLERLQAKDYVEASDGEGNEARGGRGRRFFSLSAAGADALLEARRIRLSTWEDIEPETVLDAASLRTAVPEVGRS